MTADLNKLMVLLEQSVVILSSFQALREEVLLEYICIIVGIAFTRCRV